MAGENNIQQRRRRLLLWFGFLSGGLLLLLVAVYFAATSSAFFKRVVLPKASKAANATITVDDAVIKPFSSVTLSGLKVQTTGSEPLFTVKEVHLRFSLWDIIGGKINVDEVTLVSPTVSIIQNADGTSNLDPFTKARKPNAKMNAPTAKPAKPLQLNVKNVALKNGTARLVRHVKGGATETGEISDINVTLDQLRFGERAKVTLAALLKLNRSQKDFAQSKGAGAFEFTLGPDFLPREIKGTITHEVTEAGGTLRELIGHQTELSCDVTATDIKNISIRFAQAGKGLGELRVSGPLDLAKVEGKLKLELLSIDRQALNLAGAVAGIDFGSTTLNATNQVEILKQGQLLAVSGQITGGNVSVTRKGLTTPVLDLQISYSLNVDQAAQTARVQNFSLNATQNKREFLRGELARPMTVAWGAASNAVDESALKLTVTRLNLADWRAFLGTNIVAGEVDVTLNLLSHQAGKKLDLDLSSQLDNLQARFGSNQIDRARLDVALKAQVTDLKQIEISTLTARLARQSDAVANATVSGRLDLATSAADLQTKVEAELPKLFQTLPLFGLAASAGRLEFNGSVVQRTTPAAGATNSLQTVTGKLALNNFTGRSGSNVFDNFAATFDVAVVKLNDAIRIQKLSGALSQGNQAGGTLEVTGNYDARKQAGELAIKLSDLNQAGLRPFAASALGDRTLTSVSINATTTVRYDVNGESACKGDLRIANLLITDPKNQLPRVPMTMDAKLDAGLKGGLFELRQCLGTIRQGENSGGNFDATGNYHLSNQVGRAALKLSGLNQNALRPFLAAALGDKSLTSVSIDANATANYDAKGDSSLKADLQVANLVVKDPAGKLPGTPLAIGLKLDGSMAKQILDVRQCQLQLSPTPRAKNELALAGKMNLAKSNAITGNLKLSADSLDLTPYYDLFAGEKTPKEAPEKVPAPAAINPNLEPAAMKLPLQNFVFDATIGRVFLREVTASNFIAAVKIDDGKVSLNPFHLTINGAPVNASALLNLGVPGYEYDLTLKADKVPVEPIANTFSPTYRGQAKGAVVADVKIKGAGVTGTSLKQRLNGQLFLSFTNANISIVGPKVKAVLTPIALVAGAPELLKSPINYLYADVQLGKGAIDIRHFIAHSDAFLAESQGSIPINDVFTNSPLNQPIEISLPPEVARRFRMIDDPANPRYKRLPNFAKLTGTIGNPKTKTDSVAIAIGAAELIGGAIGGKAGDVLRGIGTAGGALTGKTPPEERPGTNQPAPPNAQTNKLNLDDLIRLIPSKKK